MHKPLNPDTEKEIKEALEVYREEVERAPLAKDTKKTYLLHAGNFVRWLCGDFEPGGRNKFLWALLSIALMSMTPIGFAVADTTEDAARIERKFQIRELAREIFDRADNRAREAAKNSPTIQRNNEEMSDKIDECSDLANELIEASKNAELPLYQRRELLEEARHALVGNRGCVSMAIQSNPNKGIIEELRNDFIEEELDRLNSTMEEPKLQDLRLEIQGIST